MKKKILSLCLVVAMVATAIAGASMAYLTDTESEVNVMTVGKVDVSLIEKQRNEDGTGLEDFEQGKELTPLVGSAQGEKDEFGMPVAENYVDKIVYATNNTGKDAYIRFLLALPADLMSQTTTDTPLHWSWGNRVDITREDTSNNNDTTNAAWNAAYNYADIAGTVTIDSAEYYVMHFTMKEALAGNATSLAVMAGLYLDNRVDYNDETGKYTFNGTEIDYDLSEGVNVPILLQAVQTDGFTDANANGYAADDAFNTAFGELTVGNLEKWFAGMEAPTLVDTAEELATALAAGEDVMLTANIDAAGQVFVKGGTLNGNGTTLTVNSGNNNYESGLTVTEGTVKNVTVTGAYRGLGVGGSGASEMTGDVVYENVTVTGATYGINIGIGNGYKLTMINCTLGDWNSYSGLSGAEFIGCTFTSDGNYYASQRVSANATFTYTNCEFEQNTYDNAEGTENYYLDSYGGGNIVLDNCTMNGKAITADNVETLFQITDKVTVTFK